MHIEMYALTAHIGQRDKDGIYNEMQPSSAHIGPRRQSGIDYEMQHK